MGEKLAALSGSEVTGSKSKESWLQVLSGSVLFNTPINDLVQLAPSPSSQMTPQQGTNPWRSVLPFREASSFLSLQEWPSMNLLKLTTDKHKFCTRDRVSWWRAHLTSVSNGNVSLRWWRLVCTASRLVEGNPALPLWGSTLNTASCFGPFIAKVIWIKGQSTAKGH